MEHMIAALLNGMSPADTARLIQGRALPDTALSPRVQTRILNRTLEKAGLSQPAKGRDGKRVLRVLVPIAAAILVGLILMSIPKVAQAIQGWINDLFRTERYMRAGRDESQVNPDIEKMIRHTGQFDQSYEILLLSEVPDSETFHGADILHFRSENGYPDYDAAEFAWIKGIVPTVTDVLYDGRQLIVKTSYDTDPVPFARGYLEGTNRYPNYDILNRDFTIRVDGVEMPKYGVAHGLDPTKWFNIREEKGEGFQLEDLRADGGVVGDVIFDFPDYPGLPDGICDVELNMMVLDGSIDDLSSVGMVAEIILRFRFDTTPGNQPVSQAAGTAVEFVGEVPMTVYHWGDVIHNSDPNGQGNTFDAWGNTLDASGGTWFENRLVSLVGLSVSPTVRARNTGLAVELSYTVPEGWDYDVNSSFRFGSPWSPGLGYELLVDGQSYGFVSLGGSIETPTAEISLTPSELSAVESILLRPCFFYMAEYDAGKPLSIGMRVRYDDSINGTEPSIQYTPLPGCDIILPLEALAG